MLDSADEVATPDPTTIDPTRGSISRRGLIGGGAVVGALAAFGKVAGSPLTADAASPASTLPTMRPSTVNWGNAWGHGGTGDSALGFAAVQPSVEDKVVVPVGYVAQVIIPWGDPINPGGPAFKFDGTNTAAEQAEQFGQGHDGMAFFEQGRNRGVIAVNHEFLDSSVSLYPTTPDYTDPDTVLKSQNALGVAIAELELSGDGWKLRQSNKARRITANTPMRLTGPAAGHALLKTSADQTGTNVLGTLNNCANGRTPWGTYLTCEENFNRYFGAAASFVPDGLMKRYGVGAGDLPWWLADPRFDLAQNPNEPNRFGWVVEIDPNDAQSTPLKRTALGRIKHENASFAEADDGRAVVYMGDDERFAFLYKYVSAQPWKRYRRGQSPLDDGTLFVARFDADGTGVWIAMVPGASLPGYPSIADILIDARGAAAVLGATPMDRPEWVAVHPSQPGLAYGTFTNNTSRTAADAANPRVNNRNGHILRWQGVGGDHGAATFVWSVFALAGTGLGTGDGSTIAAGDALGSPDGLAFDPDGRLWIQTDGGQPILCNNQMLAADPVTGDVRRFLVGPAGCEITGWTITNDQRTMFVNIQHPGENATNPANPAEQSNWPDLAGRPRSATLAIRRVDGGVIGT